MKADSTIYDELYRLVMEGIQESKGEEAFGEPLLSFFKVCSELLSDLSLILDRALAGSIGKVPLEDLARENRRLSPPSKDSSALASVMSAMAPHSRPVTGSPKISRAITVVATISKFPSSEALAEVPNLRPSIRKMGAAISSAIMPST